MSSVVLLSTIASPAIPAVASAASRATFLTEPVALLVPATARSARELPPIAHSAI